MANPTRRRVLLLGDRRRSGVAAGVEQYLAPLRRRVEIVGVDLDEALDLAQVEADLLLVFGGDGSMLHVARRLGARRTPLLGVNYGRFGFLADLRPEDLLQGIEHWLAGAYTVSERARLRVRYLPEEGAAREWLALNDVVVGRAQLGRMVDVDVRIDGEPAVSYAGDGLIVATATGSTAHALAAGGPILDPTVAALVMVPIAPHALATRPLVLAGSHHIELSARGSRAPAQVAVDGAAPLPMGDADRVEVADAQAPLLLVHVTGGPFYETLRSKLGWRGRPDYAPPSPESPESRA